MTPMSGTAVSAPSSDLVHRFRAMASTVEFRLVDPSPAATGAVAAAEAVFRDVEAACTRFDPDSALMRANAAGRRRSTVPRVCFDAIAEAAAAHRRTEGRFDPRVLRALVDLGYDRTLVPGAELREPPARTAHGGRRRRRSWRPGLAADGTWVRIGPDPIDLGGIGKGLAARWAARALRGSATAALVSAGGDVSAVGRGPDGDGWHIAVEDPFGGTEPAAVLRVSDRGVATSSTRINSWRVGGRPVHHLIDPRTGAPAAADLAAVTVVDRDPATAEVWSKSLFIEGAAGIRQLADAERPCRAVDRSGRPRQDEPGDAALRRVEGQSCRLRRRHPRNAWCARPARPPRLSPSLRVRRSPAGSSAPRCPPSPPTATPRGSSAAPQASRPTCCSSRWSRRAWCSRTRGVPVSVAPAAPRGCGCTRPSPRSPGSSPCSTSSSSPPTATRASAGQVLSCRWARPTARRRSPSA